MLLLPFYKWTRLERKTKSIRKMDQSWRVLLHPPHDAKVPHGGMGHPLGWVRSPANHKEINKPAVYNLALDKAPTPTHTGI